MKVTDKLPRSVKIVEVGPRDGLQNEKKEISTEKKIELINSLSQSGLKSIEVTAFVHPRWVPQMKDAEEVLNGIKMEKGIDYSVLIPNLKGFDRAFATGKLKTVSVFTAASETFTNKNKNTDIESDLLEIQKIVEQAKTENLNARGYISTAFVCPFEGSIDPFRVREITEKLFRMGCDEVSIGDTVGRATPIQVETLMETLDSKVPFSKLALHLHDTSGLALQNVFIGLLWGVSIFDSTVGGLGGCPYAPGAPGNLDTSKLLALLESLSIRSGVDLEKILASSKLIAELV